MLNNFIVKIKRFEHEKNLPNRGNIFVNNKLFGYSIERSNLNNRPFVSRIQAGTYTAKKVFTEKRGWFWLLQDVPDRTGIILFHSGSYMEDFEGCIGNGKLLHETKMGRRMILQTRDNCKKFMKITKNINELTVIIS